MSVISTKAPETGTTRVKTADLMDLSDEGWRSYPLAADDLSTEILDCNYYCARLEEDAERLFASEDVDVELLQRCFPEGSVQ